MNDPIEVLIVRHGEDWRVSWPDADPFNMVENAEYFHLLTDARAFAETLLEQLEEKRKEILLWRLN